MNVVCAQNMIITSAKVGWKQQGTCTVVDNEPAPPTIDGYESQKGWKELGSFQVIQGGGDYLFPKDQILRVTNSQTYKVIVNDKDRELCQLAKKTTNYLVWYHHVFTKTDYNKHKQAAADKARQQTARKKQKKK